MSKSRILTWPGGEYDRNIPNVSFTEFLSSRMKEFGDRTACVNAETKEEWTYSGIIQMTNQLAAGLHAKFGLLHKQSVAIVLPNCLESPIASMAVILCGGIATIINPAQTIFELKNSVKLACPNLWIGTEDFYENKFLELYPSSKTSPPFICVGSTSRKSVLPTLDNLLQAGAGKTPPKIPSFNVNDTAIILFSSGTTGLPKGVALSHANYITARLQNIEVTKTTAASSEDCYIAMLPLFHATGLNAIFTFFTRGLRFVLLPHFTLEKMLKAIQDHKITFVSLVPPIAVQLAKLPVETWYDLSSLRVITSGAAALSKENAQILQRKFKCLVAQGYGMTEATLATHSNVRGFYKDGSIGVVQPFCESKIVDRVTNEALGPHQEGEICVRGPLLMKGYIGNEEATKSTIDKDGWLHTGDVGYYDEDGFFFITDRIKELIKYKGFQVSPSELEQILLTHPEILDAAVGPISDETAGQLPRAYVVRRPGTSVSENEVAEFLADHVSPYKKLRGGVVFVDAIPKTSSGKIIRRELGKVTSKL